MKHQGHITPEPIPAQTARRMRLFDVAREEGSLEARQARWRRQKPVQISEADMAALRETAVRSLRFLEV